MIWLTNVRNRYSALSGVVKKLLLQASISGWVCEDIENYHRSFPPGTLPAPKAFYPGKHFKQFPIKHNFPMLSLCSASCTNNFFIAIIVLNSHA